VKSESLKRIVPLACLVLPALLQPATAVAYVGPGAGLSIVGSLLAFFAAIIVGIFGFLWFPIRRILRKRKQAREQMSEQSQSAQDTPDSEPGAERVMQGDGDA
jgi:hypothetical protein